MPALMEFDDKAPTEDRRFQLGWSRVLPSGRSCASIVVTCDPSGLTFSGEDQSGAQTSVKIAGGTEGADYDTIWTMTDNVGDVYVQVVRLRVRLKT